MERIVADAREEFGEWAWGYGRGSSASSLVVNCLGITDIDPIEYGLIFERFLDYSRPDPPDIDVDADPRIRDWIKRHIVEVFGENKVCSIGTYATYKTRAVILDVARALGENLAEVSAVTKRIEPLRAFEDEAGEEFKVDQMDFDDLCEHYPELKAYFDQHPEVRTHSEILRNQVKNMGTHAGGVIVSDLDLKDRIPVCRDKSGQIVSTWGESGNVQELSAVGLVKLDLLGLKTLSVISDCVKMIEITTGKHIARADIPTSDRESILMGSKKDLVGIFQFENPVTKPIADAVGMESLMDVAVVTSLIRPGPMDAMIDGVRMPMEYARRKHGGEYKSPEFIKTALFNTHSLLVFQEDTMNLARVLAGYSPLEANRLRKSVGKKIRELMISMRDSFINGAKPRIDSGEITLVEVEDMWNQIEKFSGYGFAKPHAVAYGAITTVELWLKHNFPIQFCTALINNTKLGKKKHGSDNVLVDYINYARRREIPVLVPDINMSRDEFGIEGDSIRFALGHVKGVATAAKLIESFQPFTGIQDFYDRVKVVDEDDDTVTEVADGEAGVKEDTETEPIVKTSKKVAVRRPNRRVVESLIAAGAFDRFGTRNEMAMEYWRLRRKPTKKDRLALKVLETEEAVKEAALALVTAQQSGVEKDIKKATKALTKAEERVAKAKQAIIDDDKVDEVIADTQEDEGEAEEVVKKASKDLPQEDKTD
jgi:DNA polymerase-3 subunit alpha